MRIHMVENSSWGDPLAGLIRSFVLLRDVFGYMFSGVVFLAVGAYMGRLSRIDNRCAICGVSLPRWLGVVLLIVITYVIGHLAWLRSVSFPM